MTFSADSTHEFYYDTGGQLPTPDDVINALGGFDRIVRATPSVLRILMPDGPVGIEVYVSQITAGSLKETAIVRLIFGSEDAYERWLVMARQKMRIDKMMNAQPIITPVIAGTLAVGLFYATQRMLGREGGGGSGSTVNISNVQNSVINVGAGTFNVSPSDYLAAIKEGNGNLLNVASNACKIVKPVKRLDAGSPSLSLDGQVMLSTDTIREVPSHVDRSVAEPQMVFAENEDIILRALDLDNVKKGWAVVVPRFIDKRIPLSVDPALAYDVSKFSVGTRIKADVELYYTTDEEGNRKFKDAFLRKIR